MKISYPTEDLHKNFLSQVGGLGAILHRARQQRVDGLVVTRDQPRKCFLRAGLKIRYQCPLFGLERQRAGNIAHGEVRLHFRILPRFRNGSPFYARSICPG